MRGTAFLNRRLAAVRSNRGLGRFIDYAVPIGAVALFGAGMAHAGADTTFGTALTAFTGYLQGSGGKIITVISLAGGIVGLASGRFSLGQVAIPVGTGIACGTGIPMVNAAITGTM